MLKKKPIFRKNVPQWLKVATAVLILIPILMVNGAYTGSSVDISGALGVLSEDINIAYFATSAGLAISHPLIPQLRGVATTKNTILFSLCVQIALSAICAETDNMTVVLICSFFIGFFKAFIMIEIVAILMPILSPENKRSIFYSKFYPLTLGISQLSMMLTSELAYKYEWKYMYYFMIGLLLLAVIIVLLTFRYSPLPSIIPLLDADWKSVILSSIYYIAVIFVATYGKTMDWFHSKEIFFITFFVIPISFTLFVRRQFIEKKPFADLNIMKNPNTFVGYIFIFLGMFFCSTTSLVSSYVTSVLKLENNRLYELNISMIPGFLAAAVFCTWWFKKERKPNPVIFTGFACFIVSCIILYFTISAQGEYQLLYLPMFLRGAGMLILFVVFGVYVVQGLTPEKMLSNIFLLIGVRSVLGPALSSSFFINSIYRLQQATMQKLSENITPTNPMAATRYAQYYQSGISKGFDPQQAQQYALTNLYNLLQTQSLAVTLKTLTGWLIIFGIILLIIILIYPFNDHKKLKFIKLGKDMI
ncbi:MAG: MFS transporter [Prevotellaceae bacterium]|jgi:hypothetical protein|nr:MFS transporter [Prevotellaceae bacterium]